jgi:putative ABC transport system permease protein
MPSLDWQIGRLRLKPDLVWSMALNSLRVRLGRTVLTVLTIATASAFLVYLLTLPRSADPVERDSWTLMLSLSLLVSAAGVLNTMLMSVTQRYREIGTIKCLGALDSFVLLSVMLESALLGAIGAAIGAVVGLALAMLLGFATLGSEALGALRLDGLLWKLPTALGTGMGLAMLGAVVPAWIASKMPPMDAMRGEK